MADIKQAGKWILAGKRVKRPLWIRSAWLAKYIVDPEYPMVRLFRGKNRRSSRMDERFSLLVEDLLADDWEIAE